MENKENKEKSPQNKGPEPENKQVAQKKEFEMLKCTKCGKTAFYSRYTKKVLCPEHQIEEMIRLSATLAGVLIVAVTGVLALTGTIHF
jgi:predicted nucleic-acid-binding Zn-ribbon protein